MTIKNPILKNILLALAILVSVPILLTLLFLFYALIFNFYWQTLHWGQTAGPITLLVILAVLSWLIFRSKLATLFKAIYIILPMATVLAFIGIYFYGSPVLVYSLGALVSLGVLAYLFLTKRSWLYYFSVILISIVLLLVILLGVEI